MNDKYKHLVESLCKRPLMYTTSGSFSSVVAFFDGFLTALVLDEKIPLGLWSSWVEEKFNISSTSWGWDRILLHTYGSENSAVEALPSLFKDFVNDIEVLGEEGILQKHKNRFHSGERVPANTSTSNPTTET